MLKLKNKLTEGHVVFGTWNIIPSIHICEIFARRGLDFQILDMEHGSFSFESIHSCVAAIDAYDCAPLVRIAGLKGFDAQKVLDSGARGLVFPQVNSVEDCKIATAFLRHPPLGTRGLNPFTRSYDYGQSRSSRFIISEDNLLSIVIIETLNAYHNLDEILNIKNLDIIYLGVYDMSCAFGHPGKIDSLEVQSFIETSIAKIINAGKIVGLMCRNQEQINKYIQLGVKFIVLDVDAQIVANGIENLKQIK